MAEQNKKHQRKGWIVVLAAVLIFLCALFTANAATNGAVFRGELFQDLIVRINGKETRLKEYAHTMEETTDEHGNPIFHYSYDLPDDKSIDVYAGESYTAFAVDAGDAESVRIMGGSTDADDAADAETDPAISSGSEKQ